MINYKDAVLNLTRGTIDCMIEHPMYGWIPITLDKLSVNSDIDMKILFDYIVENDASLVTFEEPSNTEGKVFIA